MKETEEMEKFTEGKESTVLSEVAGKVFSRVIVVFTCIILVVFPLYYENYYFNILKAKYKFYWITVLAMIVVCILLGVVFLFVDRLEYNGMNTKKFISRLRTNTLKNQPVEYKALTAFWIFAALSTALSDYKFESFWGNEGRFSGLFLITLYVLSVYFIGKLGRFKKWHLDLFLISGIFVCLFGITDYFQMDILGWKNNVAQEQGDFFTSFLGNVNTYTAYVAMLMGTSCGLFVAEKNIFRCVWYYVVLLISFFAIIMGQSDNAYLALGALFIFLPFVLFRSRRGVMQYIILLASFMSTIRIIADINIKMADKVISLHGIFDYMAGYEKLGVILIMLWGSVVVLFASSRAVTLKKNDRIGVWLRIIWLFIVLSAAVLIAYVLYDANFGDNPERYAALSRYLIFNDNWGSNRGYCWRIGLESYMKQPMIHKLFGFGPDTFGLLTWDFREETIALQGVFYENAHNEYLQYLVTMGPFAVIAYLLFVGGGLVRMLRIYEERPFILAPIAAVLCYNTQNIVNINLPIATPVMWTLLAVGLALSREAEGIRVLKKKN